MILAVAFALILVGLLAGASYYFFPSEIAPYTSIVPTAVPLPVPTSTPMPAPQFPAPTPMPVPTPFHPEIEVKVASLEGFNYTEIGYAYRSETVLVLRQGTSANITLTLHSHDNESRNVSLSLASHSQDEELEGVNYRFHPSTLKLPPYGKANSTLTLEAASDAPSNMYYPLLGINIDDFYSYGKVLDFHILVFPYTPSYIFYISAEELLTPLPPPSPTSETTPPPFPAPSPTPPPPLEPELQIQRGEKAHILFYISTEIENPSLTLNLTYQSNSLPAGIRAYITQAPLKNKSLLLTITVDPQTPEATYEITAKGTVNQVTYERIFHLKITSP